MNINISVCIILLCGAVAVSGQTVGEIVLGISSTVSDIRTALPNDANTTALMDAIENFIDNEIDFMNGVA